MEGLISVNAIQSTSGPITYELEFRGPPGHVIDLLEYSMLNHLPIDLSGTGGIYSRVVIVAMNIRHELLDVSVIGGKVEHLTVRYLSVSAIPA